MLFSVNIIEEDKQHSKLFIQVDNNYECCCIVLLLTVMKTTTAKVVERRVLFLCINTNH